MANIQNEGNMDESRVEKIDINNTDWRGSREFFDSLIESFEKLDDKDEKYDFTWVGKRRAIIEAGAPINKTFRPDVTASKNWNTTENLFIEGDNLDALKLLQESYLGKVKMIYIDPPYNTGKDFVYHDDFRASTEAYDEATEYHDESGNIQFKKNEKSNGRYHSDWLSMMYPRLKLARNLLSKDGLIFISIDDNEQANLKKLCDEIYGEDNFVGMFKWNKTSKAPTLSKNIRNKYEYILLYKKLEINGLRGKASYNTAGPLLNGSNNYSEVQFEAGMITALFPDGVYPKGLYGKESSTVELLDDFIVKDGLNAEPVRIRARFKWSQSTVKSRFVEGQAFTFKKPNFATMYYSLNVGGDGFIAPSDIINAEEVEVLRNDEAFRDLSKLLGGLNIFEYTKPVSLIKYLANMVLADDFIAMDFFSGSGTLGQAIMELNAETGGSRKWIMVQLPEETNSKSEAAKAGYTTIPEIARERLRRAGEKVAAEYPEVAVDYGFRALTVTDTNYKEVYKPAGELEQSALLDVVDNIKDDRSDLDLLYGVLTQSALELNRPIEKQEQAGSDVYLYNYAGEATGLVGCFSDHVSEDTIKAIAKLKPLTVVLRDASFASSQDKVNLSEHFRILSPETKVKVI